MSLLARVEAIKPFSEDDAWGLFRLAAWAEAVGWTLLIGGIIYHHFHLPYAKYAILISGQIHGTFYIAYFGVALVTYTSLRWSRWKFLATIVCGIPPYGSLIFEQVMAYQRRTRRSRAQYRSLVLVTIAAHLPV